jgi:non-specific serine/threonine protein kinase
MTGVSISATALRERRRELGMSQSQLGAVLGISANTIARWEREEQAIGSPLLLSLALERLELAGRYAIRRDPPSERWRSDQEGWGQGDLPQTSDRLIARKDELDWIEATLERPDGRLITLVGTGGVGKTRLAVAAAVRAQRRFDAGVAWVDLAPLRNPDQVPLAIAHALGLREGGPVPAVGLLRTHLSNKNLLLVLDNFEHIAGAAWVVAELLNTCPRLKALVTSREPLHLRIEQRLAVSTLALPPVDDNEGMQEIASVELFVDRCRSVDPTFRLDANNARLVATMCNRLDGLPLALELAAARCRTIPVSTMLEHLPRLTEFLQSKDADRPERHRTLRATVEWSYQLLPEDQRTAFRTLSVFAGSATLEAVRDVCMEGGPGVTDALELMGELVDKSLVQLEVTERGTTLRYRLLETLRTYGHELLEQLGQADDSHRRHLEWYRKLLESAVPHLWGPQQVQWLDRLESEYLNLRSAIVHVLESEASRVDDVDGALAIAADAWPFWDIRGHLREAREWIEQLLPRSSYASEVHARGLDAAGWLAYGLGDVSVAQEYFGKAYKVWSHLGLEYRLAWSGAMQGLVAFNLGEFAKAESLFEFSARVSRIESDRLLMAWSLYGQAHLKLLAGELAIAANNLESALEIGPEVFGPVGTAFGMFSLGQIAIMQGDRQRALDLTRESLLLRWTARDLRTLPESLEALAGLAAEDGDLERAARLFGASETVRQFSGVQSLPWLRSARDAARATVRDGLGADRFDELWESGHRMPMPEAVDLGLARSTAVTNPPARAQLTRRERAVATMVARGMSNRDIAVELVISRRTAEAHVEHIRNKLGVATRGQVAVWAVQNGLLSSTQDRR